MAREHEDLRPMIADINEFVGGVGVLTKKMAMQYTNVKSVSTFNLHYPDLAYKQDIDKYDLAHAIIKRREEQKNRFTKRGPKVNNIERKESK